MKINEFDTKEKILIIAELSANHGGSIEVAKDTVRAAKKAGADAIKLQTYTPDTITLDCDNQYFQINNGSLWDGQNLYSLYEKAFLPWAWHRELFEVANEVGLICFSSPFDKTAVDFLNELSVPAFKIASFEIQDIPLIEYAAQFQKPMIISTGIATEEDIALAVDTCRQVGNDEIIVLRCTSAYPAPIEYANMRTMLDYKTRFNVEVGLSDHTTGIVAPTVAAALGARVIEKHFILDKNIGGPDADFSLNPAEFSEMVNAVRSAEASLGEVSYELPEKVQLNKQFARSLFLIEDMEKGERISENNVRSIRPGYGLHPKHLKGVIGKKVNTRLTKGTPLSWDVIE